MPGPLQEMIDELDLSDAELAFVEEAGTKITARANKSRILAEMYLAHKLREIADDVIESNAARAEASNRNARALNWLTLALVVVVIIQTVVIGVS